MHLVILRRHGAFVGTGQHMHAHTCLPARNYEPRHAHKTCMSTCVAACVGVDDDGVAGRPRSSSHPTVAASTGRNHNTNYDIFVITTNVLITNMLSRSSSHPTVAASTGTNHDTNYDIFVITTNVLITNMLSRSSSRPTVAASAGSKA